MKKALFTAVAMALAIMTSCGGNGHSKGSNEPLVTLDELDDYFDVKSWSFESDAAEQGVENLDKVTGSFTFEVKRNKQKMELKPSDIDEADFGASITGSWYKVVKADCNAIVRKILKIEEGESEVFTIKFVGVDPKDDNERQLFFEAMKDPNKLNEIYLDIELKDEDDDW